MTRHVNVLRRAVVVVLLAVLALSLWGSAPTSAAEEAADKAAIDHALPTDGAVRLLVSVPGAGNVDLTGVKVTVDGKDVTADAEKASSATTVQRTSILAIDTSNSMAGTRIAEAKKAALAYLAAVPANVHVGVLTFDDTVNVLVPPGLDRASAIAAITGLRLTQNTALYDGVLGALEAVGPASANAGQRKILLLSDGKDTTDTELAEVLSTVKTSGAEIDVVSLQVGDEANEPLNAIATAGKGTMLAAADPAALTAAFAEEADALARQLVVTAALPSGSEISSNVEVTVPTSTETFTAAAYVPVRTAASVKAANAAASGPQPVNTGALDLSPEVMYGAVGAIGVGLLGVVVILAVGRKPTTDQTVTEQIQAYGVMAAPGKSLSRKEAAAAASPFTGQARQAAERALASNKNLEARIAHSLEAAGMSLKPSEWLLMRAAIAVGGGLLGVLLGTGNLVLGVMLVVVALVGPWFYLRRKRTKRLNAFGTGLADTLQLMSGSLSAGLSLAQSIDTIVREGADPISTEFRRVVIETRLGVTLEDSMEGIAQRMESRDFEWVVMAIRIQREVGGNLAELLLTVAATLREREYLRRHVRALSAEGRLSCYVLGGLPPGFLAYLVVSKPDYVEPLYTTPIGFILCAAMGVLLAVGMVWMTKVAKVDV